MNHVDELVTLRTLHVKREHEAKDIIEAGVASGEISRHVKNVCAKLPIPLVERLEEVLEILEISKREFIETAVIDALDRAVFRMEECGLLDVIDSSGLRFLGRLDTRRLNAEGFDKCDEDTNTGEVG